jgi:hypothetical protein
MKQAVENADDEFMARSALAEVFRDYIPAPTPTARQQIADELRRGNSGTAISKALGVTTALKNTSAFGDEPAA